MTTEEYEENSNVRYFLDGDYRMDFSLIVASLPTDEDGKLDYDAMGRLESHCENIINLQGYPKEYEDAHEELVKAANTMIGQVDLAIDCAANMSTYFVTEDISLVDAAIADIEAMSVMVEQTGDYVKNAQKVIDGA